MNKSNAFSDYMVSYSVNRSINLSPISGRLHKQKQKGSYGPTICLLNRSREKNEESTHIQSKQQPLLQKILLLTLQIDRLNQLLNQARSQNEERMSRSKIREASYLKEENQKLRMSLMRYESLQSDNQKRIQAQVYQLKQKISMAQAENKTMSRRLKDYEKQISELQVKGKITQSIAERARLQASKMQMSLHFNSTNVDLQKSVVREKALQNQSLRQKVARCEDIIKDQKFLITGQKQQINKEKIKFLDLESKYNAELQYMRKQVQFAQRELIAKNQQEAKRYQLQIKQWQIRAETAQYQLKQKCSIIANQVSVITQQQQRLTELQQKLNDMQFACHSKVIRAEQSVKLANKQKDRQVKKVSKEINKYLEQIQLLKVVIQQYKHTLNQKQNEIQISQAELSNKLKQKQRQMKRISKRNREQQTETKLNKSISLDNSIVTNRLRASQVNLDQIVNSVMDLKTSNDRTTKLIKSVAPVKDIYYAK